MPKRRYDTPTKENPEWTLEMMRASKSGVEVLSPKFLRNIAAWQHRHGRGPQKTPTKVPITIRLRPEIVLHFREQGPGWQTRLEAALFALVSSKRTTTGRRRKAS
jgi:uncharacterized protein (DUF4415 family)